MRSLSKSWHILIVPGLFAALWWLLSGGVLSSWLIGVPVVLAASWSLQRLRSTRADSISITGLIRFVPLFLWESLRGGVDVAMRTLAPHMRIRPGLVVYSTRLQSATARVFFINCVSLLPGTLAADFNGNQLTIHMLDVSIDPEDELRRLEHAVLTIYPHSNSAN